MAAILTPHTGGPDRGTCCGDEESCRYLFFSLPLGMTEVVGAMGRVEADPGSLGALASFFGFFVILLLLCSPLAMSCSL